MRKRTVFGVFSVKEYKDSERKDYYSCYNCSHNYFLLCLFFTTESTLRVRFSGGTPTGNRTRNYSLGESCYIHLTIRARHYVGAKLQQIPLTAKFFAVNMNKVASERRFLNIKC